MDWSSIPGCLQPVIDPITKQQVDQVATLQCIPALFSNIISFALMFAGVVAVAIIIFAGMRFINSGGDPKRVQAAKQTATYAIIGLVIIFTSFFIITVISGITNVDCIKRFGFVCETQP